MEISNSPEESGVGIIAEAPEAKPQDDVVAKADYTNLQAAYTRDRQGLIETTAEVVELKPEKLATISDKKLRDAVTKKLYGYDTFETMKAIEGDSYLNKEDGDDEDKAKTLEKELRTIQYKLSQKEIDDEVNRLKSEFPDVMRLEDAEEKLNENLKLISSSIPANERVRKAFTLAFGSATDVSSVAYKTLQSARSASPESAQTEQKQKEDANSAKIREFIRTWKVS